MSSYNDKVDVQVAAAAPPVYAQPGAMAQPNMMLQGHMLTSGPTSGVCPFCQEMQTTDIDKQNGGCTWISCIGMALCGCVLGCCLIPFCVDGFKDTEHKCSQCKRIIGKKAVL